MQGQIAGECVYSVSLVFKLIRFQRLGVSCRRGYDHERWCQSCTWSSGRDLLHGPNVMKGYYGDQGWSEVRLFH